MSALRVRGRNRSVEIWAASVPVADQFVTAMIIAQMTVATRVTKHFEPLGVRYVPVGTEFLKVGRYGRLRADTKVRNLQLPP